MTFLEAEKFIEIFFSLLFFIFIPFRISGFWPELKQKCQNTIRLVILIIFVFFPTLNPQVWEKKKKKGILISFLTQFCRPRQSEKYLTLAIYLNSIFRTSQHLFLLALSYQH